jgi:hypothetical protein
MDRSASSGGQGKYLKYVTFFWPLREVALPVFNFRSRFLKKQLFEKELTKVT